MLTITRDGTWLEAMTQTATVDGQTTTSTDTNGGTWTRTGSSVSFRSSIDNTTSYTGTYNKGTLTLNDMGIVLVFVR